VVSWLLAGGAAGIALRWVMGNVTFSFVSDALLGAFGAVATGLGYCYFTRQDILEFDPKGLGVAAIGAVAFMVLVAALRRGPEDE
jgi:hypothetical protein